MHRIVEYATRDQAQQAVNTLSNQNLMGRLVYVREVSHAPKIPRMIPIHSRYYFRIVKPNRALPARPRLVQATMEVLPLEGVTLAPWVVRLPAVDVKSSSTTLAIPSVVVSSLDLRVADHSAVSSHTMLAGKI